MTGVLVAFLARRHRLAIGLCGLPPLVMGVIVGLIYPTYAREREALTSIFEMFGRFFGGDLIDLLSPGGFFSVPFQHPFTLVMMAVASAIVPFAVPAGERGQGGLELLLATRLERVQLVRAVALLAVPTALLMGLAALAGAVVGAALSDVLGEVPAAAYLVTTFNAIALTLFLGASALLLAVLARDRGRATAWFASLVTFGLLVSFGTKIVFSYLVGRWILDRGSQVSFESYWNHFAALALGALLLQVIRLVPVIGWLATVILTVIGVGAFFVLVRSRLTRKQTEITPA